MLVVSQRFSPWGPRRQLLTTRLLQTKHAAELCALLVNDLYGELPSV